MNKVIRAPQFGFTQANGEPFILSNLELETPLQKARRRHGKPFAYERGNDFKTLFRTTPFLTEWLQKGGAKK